MDQVEFRLPPDALVPLPGSVPPPRRRPAAAPTSGDPFDAFGSPPAEAAAARDDFADLESLEAIGAPQAQAAAGQTTSLFLVVFFCLHRVRQSVTSFVVILSVFYINMAASDLAGRVHSSISTGSYLFLLPICLYVGVLHCSCPAPAYDFAITF